jgi:hypothetical protein
MQVAQDLLDAIGTVLRRIPGVELRYIRAHATRSQFDLTLDSWDALILLVHAASGANVRLESCAIYPPGSQEAASSPPRALAHVLLVDEPDETAYRESLEVLGAHLVWNMHRLQWISTEDANHALELFRGAPVPRKPD